MEILKCNAEFDKVYYVEYRGGLRQCKFIRTESGNSHNRYIPCYVLDVAGLGEMRFEFPRQNLFDSWYRTSTAPSILYESVESYRMRKPIIDNYGSTGNAYNCRFIEPLFRHHSTCNCGGYTYTWKWDGCKAVCYTIENMSKIPWTWDKDGFHCTLNDERNSGCFRSEKECIAANKIQVVTFED
jgi:hypothetical protein